MIFILITFQRRPQIVNFSSEPFSPWTSINYFLLNERVTHDRRQRWRRFKSVASIRVRFQSILKNIFKDFCHGPVALVLPLRSEKLSLTSNAVQLFALNFCYVHPNKTKFLLKFLKEKCYFTKIWLELRILLFCVELIEAFGVIACDNFLVIK